MKFTMKVSHSEGGEPWLEHENRPDIRNKEEAKTWAEHTIKNFNDTLRPHEKERKLLDVLFDHEENNEVPEHDWSKINLVTVTDGRSFYDILLCRQCGLTAKRFGLDRIVIEGRWRKRRYLPCKGKKTNG